jgi:hypothetical protein
VREPHSIAEVEPYWKSLWGEKAQHNEKAEWTRKEERRKICNMDWVLIQIMETATVLSKAHSLRFPGSDHIQNY